MNNTETYKLYHHSFSPQSRRIRLYLKERNIRFSTQQEKPWLRRSEFLKINPAGEVPVLLHINNNDKNKNIAICGANTICEYLEEIIPNPQTLQNKSELMGENPQHSAEIRRLLSWFDDKFNAEVFAFIANERVMKLLKDEGPPNSKALQIGCDNLRIHLQYCEWILKHKPWLAGNNITLADLAAGGYISCLDYINTMPWNDFPELRQWYQKLKSRPSFRSILDDRLSKLLPSKHYNNLDW